jgi:hypothetical protein
LIFSLLRRAKALKRVIKISPQGHRVHRVFDKGEMKIFHRKDARDAKMFSPQGHRVHRVFKK